MLAFFFFILYGYAFWFFGTNPILCVLPDSGLNIPWGLRVCRWLFLSSQCNSGKFFITFSSQGLLLAASVDMKELYEWIRVNGAIKKIKKITIRKDESSQELCWYIVERRVLQVQWGGGGVQQSSDADIFLRDSLAAVWLFVLSFAPRRGNWLMLKWVRFPKRCLLCPICCTYTTLWVHS